MDNASIRIYDNEDEFFIDSANDDYEILCMGGHVMVLSPLPDSRLYDQMAIHFGFDWVQQGIMPSIIVRLFSDYDMCAIEICVEVGDETKVDSKLMKYEIK